MQNLSLSALSSKAFILSLVTSVVSFGAVIFDSGTTSISAAPSIQSGRISRNAIPSDWSSMKTFPGIVNPTIRYGYEAFTIPTSAFPYLQVSFYDLSGGTSLFASGYLNSYKPTGVGRYLGLDTNYLGDAGSSGSFFTAFQVILPSVSTNKLVVVVNDASVNGAGVNLPMEVIVEGFYDTNYNDTTNPAPEPASLALSGAGLFAAGILALARRKKTS